MERGVAALMDRKLLPIASSAEDQVSATRPRDDSWSHTAFPSRIPSSRGQ
jgi:hypothetical protein